MRVLLDECLPVDFRHSFSGHDAHTVQWAGFKSKKNGELLDAAERAGYEVFVTVDQGISRQQIAGRNVSILVLRTPTNQIEDLMPLINTVLDALRVIEPGSMLVISAPQ